MKKEELVPAETIDAIKNDLLQRSSELYIDAFQKKEGKREELFNLIAKKYPHLRTRSHVEYVVQEIIGLGIIDELIREPHVTDIGFNGRDLIVTTNKTKFKVNDERVNNEYIEGVINKFANLLGKEFSIKSPVLEGVSGNLRINAVYRSISTTGTTMSLRIAQSRLVLNDDNFAYLAPVEMIPFFHDLIQIRANIVIAGEVGTGKTEFSKYLMKFIPFEHKTIVIEDVAETHATKIFPEKDIINWLTSKTETITHLVVAALRNNPQWIIIAETRGAESYEMIQAVLSGHSIITSVHAIDARAIPTRLYNMAKLRYQVDASLLDDILRYFDIGVHIKKHEENGDVLRYISEIVEFDVTETRTIFKQRILGLGLADRQVKVHYENISQKLIDKMEELGIDIARYNRQKKGAL